MHLSGFSLTSTQQTYHHTPGKVRSYTEVDSGVKESIKDGDSREGFVSFGSNRVILGTDPSKKYSFMSKFERGQQLTIVKESADQDGGYEELEVRRGEFGGVSAELSRLEDGQYRTYKADQATAHSVLSDLSVDFNERWNIVK
jgi:hypothetical protein